MEERLAFAMLNLVGRQVEVRKVNGCVLSGVFCSSSVPGATPDDVQPSPNSGPYTPDGFTLRYVTHVGGQKPSAEFGPRDRVKIAWSDVETILASKAGGPTGWAATPESIASMASAPSAKKKIETDTKISSKSADSSQSKKAPHALRVVPQEWLGEPAANADLKGDHGGFDQFKVNESQFGVKSTYKEELYTTELDKSQFTAEQTAKAERMAREIENASSSNSHLLEERGKKVEGDGWDDDEEAKYGAVLGSGGYEKYKPPMRRAQEQQQQKQTPPPTKIEKPPTPTPPPPPLNVPKTGPVSYASMVKGGDTKPPTTATTATTATTPATTTNVKSSPSAELSKLGAGLPSKKSSSPLDASAAAAAKVPVDPKKKREDEIREFRQFSQSYMSPSTKPKGSRGLTPPNMALEQSPNRPSAPTATSNKTDQQSNHSNATTTAGAGTTEAAAADAKKPTESTSTAAGGANAAVNLDAEKKKKLNPNAKNFNPMAQSFVPIAQPPVAAAAVAYPAAAAPQQPAAVMMVPQPVVPPRGVQTGAAPRYVQMPPPSVMPFQPGQQAMFFPGAPPMGGYMMPVQVPYGPGAGGRPVLYYPPPPPQMYAQQMLIPVPYAAASGAPGVGGGAVPPPPPPQMQPVMMSGQPRSPQNMAPAAQQQPASSATNSNASNATAAATANGTSS